MNSKNILTDRSGHAVFFLMPSLNPVETKKEALLNVAADLFYTQGFHVTGIKQIIETAGIAKGTFYSHFKSKDAIGVAWLQQRHHQWNGMLEAFLRQQKSTPRAQLLGHFDFLSSWMASCNNRGCAFLNALSEIPDSSNPMRQEIRKHKAELHARFRDLIDAHFVGKSSTERAHIAAITFISFEGAIVETQNFGEPWPIAAARRQLQSIL
jgi:AcrR family transcriptional regulator